MQPEERPESDGKPPAAGAALVFLFCSFGFFYGLIATVDPYL